MPLVVKSGTAIDEALKLRGMRPKDIDKVLLVGGTSKIPLVKRFVAEKLAGKEPESFDKRRSDDLRGPGGGHRRRPSSRARPAWTTTPTASSWSIRSAQSDQRAAPASTSIRSSGAAADIPCSFTKTYYPVADPAERVVISVYEGDDYDNPESRGERQAGRDSLGVQSAAARSATAPWT